MTPEQAAALLGAAAAFLVALTALFVQVRTLTTKVDGRLTELLAVTRQSAHAQGVAEATPDKPAAPTG